MKNTRSSFCILHSAFCILLISGCGISEPVLSITPIQSQKKMNAPFTRAYVMRDADGDYEVVLLNDPIDRVPVGYADKPLEPAVVTPVRQVLEIRLRWRPVQSATPESPTNDNASLHWYALKGPDIDGVSVVHYAGTAFVSVDPQGNHADVTIKNGLLKLVDHRGSLRDPLGTFAISGSFDAIADPIRLQQIQTDVKTALAQTNVEEGQSSNQPPSRGLTGP